MIKHILGRTITKAEISLFPIEKFTGQIFEAQTIQETHEAVNHLSRFTMLGFDTETRPSFSKGNVNNVALLQLSTNNTCFLFRLSITGLLPVLIELLSNPNILKVGISLKNDFQNINRRTKFTPQGFLDLQRIVKEYDIEAISLQKIYALLFKKKISKNQRLTNWETLKLTESQKRYAALDAWACLKIYQELCSVKSLSKI